MQNNFFTFLMGEFSIYAPQFSFDLVQISYVKKASSTN